MVEFLKALGDFFICNAFLYEPSIPPAPLPALDINEPLMSEAAPFAFRSYSELLYCERVLIWRLACDFIFYKFTFEALSSGPQSPSMVYVLPAPVYPYMKIVPFMPFRALSTISSHDSSYTSSFFLYWSKQRS